MNIILLLTFIGIFALYKIYLNSSKEVTANLIVENTYTYLLLGLIITTMTVFGIDKSPTMSHKADSFGGLLGSFIMSMISLYIIMTSTDKVGLQHVAWLTFLASLGIMLHPTLKILKRNGKGADVFLSLIAIVGAMSLLAYKLPGMFLGLGSYLLMGLFGLIVVEVLDLLIGNREGLRGRYRWYSWIGIGLFSGFLLYDSQKLVAQAKIGELLIKYNNLKNINYPALSLSLYLDVLNLFSLLTGSSKY